MIWALTLLMIYLVKKYKADHKESNEQREIDQSIENQESLFSI